MDNENNNNNGKKDEEPLENDNVPNENMPNGDIKKGKAEGEHKVHTKQDVEGASFELENISKADRQEEGIIKEKHENIDLCQTDDDEEKNDEKKNENYQHDTVVYVELNECDAHTTNVLNQPKGDDIIENETELEAEHADQNNQVHLGETEINSLKSILDEDGNNLAPVINTESLEKVRSDSNQASTHGNEMEVSNEFDYEDNQEKQSVDNHIKEDIHNKPSLAEGGVKIDDTKVDDSEYNKQKGLEKKKMCENKENVYNNTDCLDNINEDTNIDKQNPFESEDIMSRNIITEFNEKHVLVVPEVKKDKRSNRYSNKTASEESWKEMRIIKPSSLEKDTHTSKNIQDTQDVEVPDSIIYASHSLVNDVIEKVITLSINETNENLKEANDEKIETNDKDHRNKECVKQLDKHELESSILEMSNLTSDDMADSTKTGIEEDIHHHVEQDDLASVNQLELHRHESEIVENDNVKSNETLRTKKSDEIDCNDVSKPNNQNIDSVLNEKRIKKESTNMNTIDLNEQKVEDKDEELNNEMESKSQKLTHKIIADGIDKHQESFGAETILEEDTAQEEEIKYLESQKTSNDSKDDNEEKETKILESMNLSHYSKQTNLEEETKLLKLVDTSHNSKHEPIAEDTRMLAIQDTSHDSKDKKIEEETKMLSILDTSHDSKNKKIEEETKMLAIPDTSHYSKDKKIEEETKMLAISDTSHASKDGNIVEETKSQIVENNDTNEILHNGARMVQSEEVSNDIETIVEEKLEEKSKMLDNHEDSSDNTVGKIEEENKIIESQIVSHDTKVNTDNKLEKPSQTLESHKVLSNNTDDEEEIQILESDKTSNENTQQNLEQEVKMAGCQNVSNNNTDGKLSEESKRLECKKTSNDNTDEKLEEGCKILEMKKVENSNKDENIKEETKMMEKQNPAVVNRIKNSDEFLHELDVNVSDDHPDQPEDPIVQYGKYSEDCELSTIELKLEIIENKEELHSQTSSANLVYNMENSMETNVNSGNAQPEIEVKGSVNVDINQPENIILGQNEYKDDQILENDKHEDDLNTIKPSNEAQDDGEIVNNQLNPAASSMEVYSHNEMTHDQLESDDDSVSSMKILEVPEQGEENVSEYQQVIEGKSLRNDSNYERATEYPYNNGANMFIKTQAIDDSEATDRDNLILSTTTLNDSQLEEKHELGFNLSAQHTLKRKVEGINNPLGFSANEVKQNFFRGAPASLISGELAYGSTMSLVDRRNRGEGGEDNDDDDDIQELPV